MDASGLPLYYWRQPHRINFGDYISLKLVERIVGCQVESYSKKQHGPQKKLLAIGSILSFAVNKDVVWGSGVNGKLLKKSDYSFEQLDIRAVRGPLTKAFLEQVFGIQCPGVFGDPGLLFPFFFPELKRSEEPKYEYVVIPHYSEESMFPKNIPLSAGLCHEIIYPTEPWDEVIAKILQSKFVISSSLHGLVIADAYGIPARLLRVTENEQILKYIDYYSGTGRPQFRFATSIEEALFMGGEAKPECDLEKLYQAFPFDFWPHIQPRDINFTDGNTL